MEKARVHLEFCMELCRIQWEQGLYFLFEHPWTATSWENEQVQEIWDLHGVQRVKGDMCQFGMVQHEGGEEVSVKKPTGFMSNSPKICERLRKLCPGKHKHISLTGGRAKIAEIYPDALCSEILKGVIEQMRIDGRIGNGGD